MILGTGAANIEAILFQIGSQRYLLFDFNGTDVTGWTPQLTVSRYPGDRTNEISLTIGNGLSYPIYETDQILASFSEANTSLEDREYYLELRRRDLDLPIFSTKARFSYDSPQGDAQELSFTNEEQTISITLGNQVINVTGGGGTWGSITGTLSDQTDLQAQLDLKATIVYVDSVRGRRIHYKNNVSNGVTGTTNETIMDSSCLVPAGTIQANDIVLIVMVVKKSGTAGTHTHRMYANTTPVISGATNIWNHPIGATNIYYKSSRSLIFKNSVSSQEIFNSTTSGTEDGISTAAITALSINFAVDQYIFPSTQLGSAADTCTLTSWFVEIIRT